MKRDGGKGEGLRMKAEDRKGGGGGGGGLFLGRGEARKLKGAPNYGTMREGFTAEEDVRHRSSKQRMDPKYFRAELGGG